MTLLNPEAMKSVSTALFIVLFCVGFTYAQGCLSGGITFSSQSQIDNFQTDYPGCTVIEGSVQLSGSNINSLAGLNVISEIQGQLKIQGGFNLDDLAGLSSLTRIGGNLSIWDNNHLKNVERPRKPGKNRWINRYWFLQ